MYADNGRLNVHRPFLDRLSQKKPDAACSLAAFLLLNVIDGLRHQNFDADALNLRVNAAYNPLATVSDREPQVRYLVRLAERLRQAIQQRQAVLVIPELLGYAEWLAFDSRFEEGLSVIDTGRFTIGREGHTKARAMLARSRGLTLRQMGKYDGAEQSFEEGSLLAAQDSDATLRFKCQNGLARTWAYQGRDQESKELLSRIKLETTTYEFRREHSSACHDLAVTVKNPMKLAIGLLAEAYEGYEDHRSRRRALCDLGGLLVDAGYVHAADKCLRSVRTHNEGKSFGAIALENEIKITGALGDRVRFERALNEYDNLDRKLARSSDVDLRIRIAQGFLTFGDKGSARICADEALALARTAGYAKGTLEAVKTLRVVNGHATIQSLRVSESQKPISHLLRDDRTGRVASLLDASCRTEPTENS